MADGRLISFYIKSCDKSINKKDEHPIRTKDLTRQLKNKKAHMVNKQYKLSKDANFNNMVIFFLPVMLRKD